MSRNNYLKQTPRIRIRPTTKETVWNVNHKKMQLDASSGKAHQEFNFDEILTGSENKPVYNAVARNHVCAAMDGYNAVIFAYGQTASGKTFTLVRVPPDRIAAIAQLQYRAVMRTNPVLSLAL